MFKVTQKSKIMCSLLLLVCCASSAQAASYNLNCKLGGHMGIKHDSRTKMVTGNFTAASAGTRSHNLSLGQCSWVDRGLRGNEPRKFCQRNVRDVIVKLGPSSFRLQSRSAPYLGRVKGARGGYFSLRVSSRGSLLNRKGCLNVIRVNRFSRARTVSGR